MSASDVIARHADARPEMTLVDYVEVGLPAWRILARCDVLESKPLSVIDETAMRAISLGVHDPLELQVLLGLDEQVLDSTLTGLVAQEWAQGAKAGTLVLTEAGQEVLTAALQIVSRELVVPFDYDGLLRRPIFDHRLVDRRRGAAAGLRAVPAAPERQPDLDELRACRSEIARSLHDASSRRDQESQLLAIRSIDRRERYFLPATALVFAPQGRGRCEIALMIGDELSVEHEIAFVNANLADRLGLDRRLRATQRRPLPQPGPAAHRDAIDNDAEAEARRALCDVRERHATSDDDGQTAGELRNARAALNNLPVRTVQPHEHQTLLHGALNSQRRLLIAGGAATTDHVDGQFLRRLRQCLDRGTLVRIIVAGAAPEQDQALQALKTTAGDYPNLIVEQRELTDTGALLSDDHFVALGAFPWLGQLGDRDRSLTDTRSLLVHDSELISETWTDLDGRTPGAATPGVTRRRQRRKPRSDKRRA